MMRKEGISSFALPLFERPQICSHIMHLSVLRIVELNRHFFVGLVRIVDIDFRKTCVRIASDRLTGTVGQNKGYKKIVIADESAVEFGSVGHGHGCRSWSSAAPGAPAIASAEAAAGHPSVLERSRVGILRTDPFEVARYGMTFRAHGVEIGFAGLGIADQHIQLQTLRIAARRTALASGSR